VVKLPDFTAQRGGKTRPAFGYDPWAGAWRPDWGPEGNPLRTMEERRRDGMVLPSRGDVIRPLSCAASGHDAGVHMKAGAAAYPHAGGYADGGGYGDMLFGGTGVTPQQPKQYVSADQLKALGGRTWTTIWSEI